VQDHGVKFIHHDEENVLLEFKTGQHFVFPDGGGKAIIDCLMGHIEKYKNCDVHWETEGRHLLTDKRGCIKGLQVRKKDGLLYELFAPNVYVELRYVGGRMYANLCAVYLLPEASKGTVKCWPSI